MYQCARKDCVIVYVFECTDLLKKSCICPPAGLQAVIRIMQKIVTYRNWKNVYFL